MQIEKSQQVTERFFKAVERLKSDKRLHSLHEFTKKAGCDYSNVKKLQADKSRGLLQVGWLTLMVEEYGVNPMWLLTGNGTFYQ